MPCNFTNKPHALHKGFPSLSRLQSGVALVRQLLHENDDDASDFSETASSGLTLLPELTLFLRGNRVFLVTADLLILPRGVGGGSGDRKTLGLGAPLRITDGSFFNSEEKEVGREVANRDVIDDGRVSVSRDSKKWDSCPLESRIW